MTPQDKSVPYGFCHCGCSVKTKTRVDGTPYKFVTGHWNRAFPKPVRAVPFKIDGVYCRLIPLTKGQYAIVDETDYEWLMRWKWSAWWGKTSGCFYAIRNSATLGGKRHIVRMHREVLGLHRDSPLDTDHIQPGNGLDNRRANLRAATRAQNVLNSRKRGDNTSGCKGVSLSKSRNTFAVRVIKNGKRVTVAYCKDKQTAIALRNTEAKRQYGEFDRE